MKDSVYMHATKILDRLRKDKSAYQKCQKALSKTKNGEKALNNAHYSEAVDNLISAIKIFEDLPHSHLIQGILKTDMAVASYYLGDHNRAVSFAQRAIQLMLGEESLVFTRFKALMTLSNTYYMTGDIKQSLSYIENAKELIKRQPEGEQYLPIMDHHEMCLKALLNSDKSNCTVY